MRGRSDRQSKETVSILANHEPSCVSCRKYRGRQTKMAAAWTVCSFWRLRSICWKWKLRSVYPFLRWQIDLYPFKVYFRNFSSSGTSIQRNAVVFLPAVDLTGNYFISKMSHQLLTYSAWQKIKKSIKEQTHGAHLLGTHLSALDCAW